MDAAATPRVSQATGRARSLRRCERETPGNRSRCVGRRVKGTAMHLLQRKLGLISLALMLPALFLSTAGIVYAAFGIEGANRLLDAMLAQAVFKLLLSPVVVLGGPLVAFALNAWKVFHVSADVVNEEFV